MGEHLWHRVAEWGQPPALNDGQVLLTRLGSDRPPVLHVYGVDRVFDDAEWCVVDLPTEYAPAPLRNGWRAMDTCPEDRGVLAWFDSGRPYPAWFRKGEHATAVAWMPLPAGPYDPEPQGVDDA